MKIILDDKIIETGLIYLIVKECKIIGTSKGNYYPIGYLNIKIVGGSTEEVYPKHISTSKETEEEAKKDLKLIDDELEEIIKFIDKHSDKSNYPFPRFE